MASGHLVLYRKYRPRDFDEVIGQEHVVVALKNSLKMGKIAHAYLFSGPRGVGKTTVARLIAKALNCEDKNKPCDSCASCKEFQGGRAMDLIEIDAASNRGIDEIRALREGTRFVPSQGKYKTYVIDECHSLTKDAFNALLKTLEEPPSHVVFVLATTELEKVPATIVSRTQHYPFRRIGARDIAARLGGIAKKEGISLEQDAAILLAFAAEGSMRDAESILGQIMAVEDKKITRTVVEDVLGLPRREAAKKMFELIAKKDVAPALALIQKLTDAGHDMSYFSKLLMQYFRSALFLKTDPALKQFVEEELLPDELECINANLDAFGEQELSRGINIIFQNMQDFKRTPIPQLPLEVTVIELINSSDKQQEIKDK
ncbi:MAG: DNA polymerase III, subunit gamma and tau [Candidatus Sungbacteria bacterium RIFCSPHIGHO2_02_FULL_47_11]|uniref:DNA polymerase III subunit gamma/tau n=1 Tax=Candidatus Sungbacteria bacterium RIFCSPHIGHO2_02_FULL_47_11 TaxID=1802270 RepID=A0A1G2KIB7_9BACT|nr:MAG: DNA polymerase III, subunit gamma and tau [Candidatus Sungbacteria bacterium RIFCSPHIGHO2_02_FULL_47_11]